MPGRKNRTAKPLLLALMTALVIGIITSCGVARGIGAMNEEDFQEAVTNIQTDLSEMLQDVDGHQFGLTRELRETSCDRAAMRGPRQAETRLVAGAAVDVGSAEEARALLDALEETAHQNYGWRIGDRLDDSVAPPAESLERSTLSRSWGEDDFETLLLVRHEYHEDEDGNEDQHVVTVQLQGECVTHADSDRHSSSYHLDLPEYEGPAA